MGFETPSPGMKLHVYLHTNTNRPDRLTSKFCYILFLIFHHDQLVLLFLRIQNSCQNVVDDVGFNKGLLDLIKKAYISCFLGFAIDKAIAFQDILMITHFFLILQHFPRHFSLKLCT